MTGARVLSGSNRAQKKLFLVEVFLINESKLFFINNFGLKD